MDRFTLAQIDFTTDSLYISNTGASQPTLKPPLPRLPTPYPPPYPLPTHEPFVTNILANDLTRASGMKHVPSPTLPRPVTSTHLHPLDRRQLFDLKAAMDRFPQATKKQLISRLVYLELSDGQQNRRYDALVDKVIEAYKQNPNELGKELEIAYRFQDWGKSIEPVHPLCMTFGNLLNPSPPSGAGDVEAPYKQDKPLPQTYKAFVFHHKTPNDIRRDLDKRP